MNLADVFKIKDALETVLTIPAADRPAASAVLDWFKTNRADIYKALLAGLAGVPAQTVLAVVLPFLRVDPSDRPWVESLVLVALDRAKHLSSSKGDFSTGKVPKSP